MSKIYHHLQETIRSLLSKVVISICANIWSKPGMKASFLSVTAHLVFTDNGSNMVAVFKAKNIEDGIA